MINEPRLAAALFYWMTVLMATIIVFLDSRKRMKYGHVLTFAFGSLLLGSTSLIIRQFLPNAWELGLAISMLAYAVGVLIFWLHFELMTKERPSTWMIVPATMLMTLLGIGIVGTTGIHFFHDSSALFFSFTGLLIMAVFSLSRPLLFATREYIRYHQRQPFLEATGYLSLLAAAINFYFDYMWNRFDTIYNSITIILGALGVLMVIMAYLLNKAYLYRLPFDVHYLFCFHDSGINFYQRRLTRKPVEIDDANNKTRAATADDDDENQVIFLTGILGATEAIFKKILQRQVKEIKISCDDLYLFFARDQSKRIGVGVICQSITWYLKQAIKHLLESIPPDIITMEGDPSTMKIIEHHVLQENITPLVKNAFPYFTILTVLE